MTKSTQPPNNSELLEGALRDAVRAINASAPPANFGKKLLAEAATWRHPVAPKTYVAPASRSPLIGLIAASIAASIFFLWFTGNNNVRKIEVATGQKFQPAAEEFLSRQKSNSVDFDASGDSNAIVSEPLAKAEHFAESESRQMARDPQAADRFQELAQAKGEGSALGMQVEDKAKEEERKPKLAELGAIAAKSAEKPQGDTESANFNKQRGSEPFGANALKESGKKSDDELESKNPDNGLELPATRFSRAISGEMTDRLAAGKELTDQPQAGQSKSSEAKSAPQREPVDALKKSTLEDMTTTPDAAKRSGITQNSAASAAPGPGGRPRGSAGGFGGGSASPNRRDRDTDAEKMPEPSKAQSDKKDSIQDRDEPAGKRERAKSKSETQDERKRESEEADSARAKTGSDNQREADKATEKESKKLNSRSDNKPGNAPRMKADAAPIPAPRDKATDPDDASPKPDAARMVVPAETAPRPPAETPAAIINPDAETTIPGAPPTGGTRKTAPDEMEDTPSNAPGEPPRASGRGAAPGSGAVGGPGIPGAPTISGGVAGAPFERTENEALIASRESRDAARPAHRFLAISDNSTLLYTTGGTTPLELGQVVPNNEANLLHVFDWAKPEKSRILAEIGPTALTASPSGDALLNANGVLFELPEKKVELLAALGDNIRSLAISPTGKEVVSLHINPASPTENFYRLSELPSGEERFVLPKQAPSNQWSDTFAVGFAASSDAFALVDKDRNIREYSLSTGAEKKILAPALPSEAVALEYAPNGKLLAVAMKRSQTLIYSTEIARQLRELKPELPPPGAAVDPISALRFSPDSNFLAASNSQRLFFWNLATGEVAAQLPEGSGGAVYLRYTEDGKKITAIKGFTQTQTEEGKPALKYPTAQEFEVPQAARKLNYRP